MASGALVWVGLGWWTASTAMHWATATLAGRRHAVRDPHAVNHAPSDFSIVAPLSGADDASAAYIEALMALSGAGAEILICVATPEDGAIAPVRALWSDAPILIGTDTTFNPKMNNVRKGLEAASRPFVALCDAGILLDAENLRRAALPLSDKVGLVLALKAGEAPGNFAAELERAYIDGHQARFLLAADRLGIAVASGGVTLMSRDTLQKIGACHSVCATGPSYGGDRCAGRARGCICRCGRWSCGNRSSAGSCRALWGPRRWSVRASAPASWRRLSSAIRSCG